MSKKQNAYSTQTDAALAELSRQGNEEAFDELVRRYLSKIGYMARRYSAQGYEQNDFVQEGLLGLLSACRSYDGSTAFSTYLTVVAERRFISIIRRMNTQRAVPDAALVRLEGLEDALEDSATSPEQLLMEREQLSMMQSKLRALLSEREYQVLMLYASGLSYAAIAKKLGVSEKSVDNALQRVRRKAGGLY